MTNRSLRIPKETLTAADEFCKRERVNFSTFCRMAIHEKLSRDTGLEDRLVATMAGISSDVKTTMVMLDSLVKSFFICVPEPMQVEVARDAMHGRYEKYVEYVASAIGKNGAGGGGLSTHKGVVKHA